MAVPATIKAKVCLIGEIAVGKTSLVRRFSLGSFDELYSTTLGISVSKKTIQPANVPAGGPRKVEMILFDVMGQRRLRDLLVESYFKGAQALLAVWDIMRPETLPELRSWIAMAREVVGPVTTIIAANKVDLAPNREVESVELKELAGETGCDWYTTSAKTGENVEAAFERLAVDLIRRSASKAPPRAGMGRAGNPRAIAQSLVHDPPKRA